MIFLPIGIRHIIGQHLGVMEREALGLPPRKLSKERITKFQKLWSIRPRAYNSGSIRRVMLTTWDHFLLFPYVHCQIDLDIKTNDIRVVGFDDKLWTTIWRSNPVLPVADPAEWSVARHAQGSSYFGKDLT